jgi:hypothetical protein
MNWQAPNRPEFYAPNERGFERDIKKRLEFWARNKAQPQLIRRIAVLQCRPLSIFAGRELNRTDVKFGRDNTPGQGRCFVSGLNTLQIFDCKINAIICM